MATPAFLFGKGAGDSLPVPKVKDGDFMSLRPIDFQSMVPKVTERARAQNEEQHRGVTQQQQQAEQASKGAQQKTDTVVQQEEAQKADIRDKESERRRRDGKKKKRDEDEKEDGTKTVLQQPKEGRTIDIRL